MIRPRLTGNDKAWDQILDIVRKQTPEVFLSNLLNKKDSREIELNPSEGTAREVFTVDHPPTTLEDALRNSKVDLSVWKVQKWIWNHWAGNYQVKVWFEEIKEERSNILKNHLDELRSSFQKVKIQSVKGSGVGVVSLADFHYGFDYKGDLKNPPFSVDILTQKVRNVAEKINSLGFDKIHIALLGDFIESFTGLNHMDVWKHLSSYGATAARGISELIARQLIGRINNVEKIYLLAGNHDRVSVKSDIDSKGEAARLIFDFLDLMLDIPIEFDYAVLNPEIDGIKYILTHGHLGLAKRDEYATILEFGDQSLYNLMIQGHNHTREVKKNHKFSKNMVEKVVSIEGSNFRKITVPPLVSGGTYSLSIGGFGTCGMTVTSNNGSGGVNHLDLSV